MAKKTNKVVMVVVQRDQAIDFTKVYTLRATRTIRAGDVICFDTAETELTREAHVTSQP